MSKATSLPVELKMTSLLRNKLHTIKYLLCPTMKFTYCLGAGEWIPLGTYRVSSSEKVQLLNKHPHLNVKAQMISYNLIMITQLGKIIHCLLFTSGILSILS